MSLKDYRHWNEDAQRVWWEEEGKHADEGPPYCDECGFNHAGECQFDDEPDDEEDEDELYDRKRRERKEGLYDDYQPDEHLDMYMEDRMSGGGGDVDFD